MAKAVASTIHKAKKAIAVEKTSAFSSALTYLWSKAQALCMVLGVLLVAGITVCAPASAQVTDPALQQTVTDQEQFAPRGQAHTFTQGHADLGVRVDEGPGKPSADGVSLMLRDDASEQPIWRHLEDVVFAAGDAAQMQLPQDEAYGFIQATPTNTVWVLPQTQVPGVPWLGWSTQSPGLVKQSQQGVTLKFLGHQGPGQVSMFLQAGGFSKPNVLWNSAITSPQPMWVDRNTHAHANWVFTQAGAHLVAMGVSITLPDGTKRSTVQLLRFAIGVPPRDAQTAQWAGALPRVGEAPSRGANAQGANGAATSQTGNAATRTTDDDETAAILWIWVGIAIAVLVMVGICIWILRSSHHARQVASREQARRREDLRSKVRSQAAERRRARSEIDDDRATRTASRAAEARQRTHQGNALSGQREQNSNGHANGNSSQASKHNGGEHPGQKRGEE